MQKIKIFIVGILLVFLFPQNVPPMAEDESPMTALLLIDIQNFYFPEGRVPLANPEEASLNAKKLLEFFRQQKWPVVHVRHNAKSGTEIHKNVSPTGLITF